MKGDIRFADIESLLISLIGGLTEAKKHQVEHAKAFLQNLGIQP